jgi:predicted regulator of amino acid metabolism with ACT domain
MLKLEEVFPRKRSQRNVAEFLLKRGIRVSEDRRFFVGEVEVSGASIARALDLDRRVVCSAAEAIIKDPVLRDIFGKLSATLLLKDVAREMGFGAIEFIPKDASSKGIISSVAKVIAESGISIRQITTDDPMFDNPAMTIVTEKPLPGDVIDRILGLPEVKKVVVLS